MSIESKKKAEKEPKFMPGDTVRFNSFKEAVSGWTKPCKILAKVESAFVFDDEKEQNIYQLVGWQSDFKENMLTLVTK